MKRIPGRRDWAAFLALVLILGAVLVYGAVSPGGMEQVGKPVAGWTLRPGTSAVHLAVTPRGTVFVSDASDPAIRAFTPVGRELPSWRLHGSSRSLIEPGSRLFVDGRGRLYVPATSRYDNFTQSVYRFSPSGQYRGAIPPPRQPHTFSTGALTTVGWSGNLYYSTTVPSPAIREADTRGRMLVGYGSQCYAAECSPERGQIHELDTVNVVPAAVDRGGNLYVVDASLPAVIKFSPSGRVLSVMGGSGTGPGEFNGPDGIAVDTYGNVYVADTGNNRIQKLSPDGEPLAVTGTRGAQPGQFKAPTDIAVDGHGNVYVLDSGNNRIQKFVPAT
jgi:streptogramin lyase